MASQGNETERIAGIIERLTYHNPDNGFCVLKLHVKGKKDLITVVGHIAVAAPGEYLLGTGSWFHDKQHGLQFKATFLKTSPPAGIEGIEKYLASGLIKGVGPVYANKLVKAFGEGVFQIIEEEPYRLQKVAGIGPLRANKIIGGWAEQKSIRDIMLFLHSHGISTARAVKIYKTYGENAVEIISENPYQLSKDVRGIGFISADKIAEKLGIARDSIVRAKAGITYSLTQAMDEGHCGLPTEQLVQKCGELLQISQELVLEALSFELKANEVIEEEIEGTSCIFLKGLAMAEGGIAERIFSLQRGELPWGKIDTEAAIGWVENKTNVILSSSQKEAINKVLWSKAVIITGGPGVGKTTLVNSIIKILRSRNQKISLAAPTGRAAKRLTEVTGIQAQTLHRLLKVNMIEGGALRNEQYPVQSDVIIVDEVSMIDVPLMYSLLKAIPPTTAIILVGDVDQLPSVGPGQVLRDLIDSDAVTVVRLTEVFRQAAESQIITNAHRINQGLMPLTMTEDKLSDFYFIEAQEPEKALSSIIKLVSERIPRKFNLSAITEIQVLCPMTRGVIGTRNLNIELQSILNKPADNAVSSYGWLYGAGDKVMQIENNYDKDVYNGDVGFITRVNNEEQELIINFDGREVSYDFRELDEIVLAYATTIHKSQGSEYKAVVIPIMMQHYTMLQKNLIYTAVTRGKQLVVLVGEKKALAIALSKKKNIFRWSLLKKRLAEVIEGF